MDPPRHDELRRLVSRAFTPRRVAALEDRTRELCAQFLDPQVGGPGFDYVEDFAAKIPAMLIGALLGVPKDDQDQLRIWGDLMMRYEPDGPARRRPRASRTSAPTCREMVRDRQRQHPRDDMVSDLLAAEITRDDGTTRQLSFNEVIAFFTLLQLAGSETTARLLGWAAVLLARHPGATSRACSPRPTWCRTRSRSCCATRRRRRSRLGSSPRRRMARPDRARSTRRSPCSPAARVATSGTSPMPIASTSTRTFDRHVTFGYGIHFCLGANLARLEGRIVIDETLARFPEWSVDEAKVEMVRTSTVRGPGHVPVTV